MRLLHTLTFETRTFPDGETPPYAILSHTWEEEEVTYADLQDLQGTHATEKKGFEKIRSSCYTANTNGFDYIWIDTCCIDKTSRNADLTEIVGAINSMYRWYGEATICYAYLADIVSRDEMEGSRWFTRGWTLQELIAPRNMVFLNKHWKVLGTKSELRNEISKRTRIPIDILMGKMDLEQTSVAQRMAWAVGRQTSRMEDRAYSLLGIFGVNMPLLYGEGQMAFIRLQEEIMKATEDESLFAWTSRSDIHNRLLAASPDDFNESSDGYSMTPKSPWDVSNRGVRLELPFLATSECGIGLAILNCTRRGKESQSVAIYIRDIFLTFERFQRIDCKRLALVDLSLFRPNQYPSRLMTFQHQRVAGARIYVNVKVNPTYNEGRTLLSYAAEKGNMEIAWLLLSRRDIRADKEDDQGRTPLSYAAEAGHINIVWLLLSRSDVNVSSNDASGSTPLSYAARSGNVPLTKILLSQSEIRRHIKDGNGRTPLSHAAECGRHDLVRMLLDMSDIDADEPCKSGQTPICLAAANVMESLPTPYRW
ncbi:ankyrin 2,3/unc44 [Aspergillus oryzae 3.042]|uniref:Ankyrin 2,3/unc44 n=1 Tax=Aspergillus oryzae (strain 3.042) TaxID=1160506 RepID=I8U8E9_ASPO3|nr:ankyrin 2,3/unc44 [Aspergillus oryzae 3.042]|eukprot:EIT83215.1 ankyrin 2,3/unc44 [Aspergillus oryzae 3.042]